MRLACVSVRSHSICPRGFLFFSSAASCGCTPTRFPHVDEFYIDGRWVAPAPSSIPSMPVINPATELPITRLAMGSEKDVDAAVAAAKKAFVSFSQTTRKERLDLLTRIIELYKKRSKDIAEAITTEMGATITLATTAQAPAGLGHIVAARKVLKTYEFETKVEKATLYREPIGVCSLICPWNWPMSQVTRKVAPALATGCTMVLKPSEYSALSAIIMAEIIDEAKVPAGVFNMIHGYGPTVGAAMSRHPDVDMVSFTGSTRVGIQTTKGWSGSTRAGVDIAKTAADTIKRVSTELGGKSPNIVLDHDKFDDAVKRGAVHCFNNVGQSCNSPTRMLVPRNKYDRALEVAKGVADKLVVGDPTLPATQMGPLVNRTQFEKVQALIQAGINEGAKLVAGGVGRPQGLDRGFFVRPTVFGNVNNQMTIAREEIFGPVLSVIPFDTIEEAIEIANDTPYGLSSYIQGSDMDLIRKIAARMRTGMVHINGTPGSPDTPFGGYKQSGNGREQGVFGVEDFLEVKAVHGQM